MAIFRSDGAAASAFDVFVYFDVAADGVVITVRKPWHDHHDGNHLLLLIDGNATVRRSNAITAASFDQGDVGNNVDDVRHVGDESFEINHCIPGLARRVLGVVHDLVLLFCGARYRGRVVNGRCNLWREQKEK